MDAALHSYCKRVKLFPADPRTALAAVTSRQNANWLQSQTRVNIRRRQQREVAQILIPLPILSGGWQENIGRISAGEY